MGTLERDVPHLGLRCGFRWGVSVAVRRAIVLANAEDSQGGHHDFADRFARPLTILVLPRLKPTFDKNLHALFNGVAGDCRQLIPSDAANPFDPLPGFSPCRGNPR